MMLLSYRHYAMFFRMFSVEIDQEWCAKNGPLGNPKRAIYSSNILLTCLYTEGSFKPCSIETVYISLTQYIFQSVVYIQMGDKRDDFRKRVNISCKLYWLHIFILMSVSKCISLAHQACDCTYIVQDSFIYFTDIHCGPTQYSRCWGYSSKWSPCSHKFIF